MEPVSAKAKKYFTAQLVNWHTTANERSLPWKNEIDPYRIWLSEVILQQTRALQALPYYLRFTDAYPTVKDLADAPDEEVFRLWQGLGYYNRCKNMLATARYIARDRGGAFPQTYDDLLLLRGIGPYTAAAIASFAFGLPHAVVDGNVYRVLARYFGIDTPFDTTIGKQTFAELAQQLLDKANSAAYNQAIMDLGATVCTPQNPVCGQCPLQANCVARRGDLTAALPVRSKKQAVRKRYFHYLLLIHRDNLWIRKRGQGDIWENLHEPILIESENALTTPDILKDVRFTGLKIKYDDAKYSGKMIQRLTHQVIESHFFTISVSQKVKLPENGGKWMGKDELRKTAFPKTLVSFLENNLYF